MAQIKKQIEQTESEFDREKLQERIAKLSGGVAIIKVGAATETEMKEKKHRVEDAVAATKAAIEEGIVPGGGVALLRAGKVLHDVGASDPGEVIGLQIVKRALEEPVRMIAENAGKDGSVVVEKVKSCEGAHGYDATRDDYEDLISRGIVDPTKVTRSALQNAASIAVMIITTEAAVTDIPKPEEPAPAMPAGMGGMPGMM